MSRSIFGAALVVSLLFGAVHATAQDGSRPRSLSDRLEHFREGLLGDTNTVEPTPQKQSTTTKSTQNKTSQNKSSQKSQVPVRANSSNANTSKTVMAQPMTAHDAVHNEDRDQDCLAAGADARQVHGATPTPAASTEPTAAKPTPAATPEVAEATEVKSSRRTAQADYKTKKNQPAVAAAKSAPTEAEPEDESRTTSLQEKLAALRKAAEAESGRQAAKSKPKDTVKETPPLDDDAEVEKVEKKPSRVGKADAARRPLAAASRSLGRSSLAGHRAGRQPG